MKFIKKVTLNENTFIEYNTLLLRRKSLLQWVLMAIIIAAAVAYFDILESIALSILLGIFLGVVFVGLSYFLGVQRVKKNAVAAYKEQQLKSKHLVYTISEKGVNQKGKLESSDYAWNRFRTIKETKSGFYFFYAKLNALMLSKEALTEAEVTMIRAIIKENHPKK